LRPLSTSLNQADFSKAFRSQMDASEVAHKSCKEYAKAMLSY